MRVWRWWIMSAPRMPRRYVPAAPPCWKGEVVVPVPLTRASVIIGWEVRPR